MSIEHHDYSMHVSYGWLRLMAKARAFIHHGRLVMRFAGSAKPGKKYAPFAVLRSGEVCDIIGRNGRNWLLFGGKMVHSDAICAIEDMGDRGY